MRDGVVTVFLGGDVMLGRGVDQILPHPGDPTLHEAHLDDARSYVAMAEQANGPIPRPVDVSWPWGEALTVLEQDPDVRVINLETSVTHHDGFAAGKAVHYRMSPDNVACLSAARPDVCALANNHVLDFGLEGLEGTLDVLAAAGLEAVGAGRDAAAAWRPAVIPLEEGGRVLVFSMGMVTSGIPRSWAATEDGPGIALLDERRRQGGLWAVVDRIREWKQPGDLVVASIHWGSNWGYGLDRAQTRVAHTLIEGGVDVVHGHSSHHPRPLEIHRDRLILYGCGDLVDDYEGIAGHEQYRDDLRLLYLADLDERTGALVRLRLIPMQARRLRLERASAVDTDWLRSVLDRMSRHRGAPIEAGPSGELVLRGLSA